MQIQNNQIAWAVQSESVGQKNGSQFPGALLQLLWVVVYKNGINTKLLYINNRTSSWKDVLHSEEKSSDKLCKFTSHVISHISSQMTSQQEKAAVVTPHHLKQEK